MMEEREWYPIQGSGEEPLTKADLEAMEAQQRVRAIENSKINGRASRDAALTVGGAATALALTVGVPTYLASQNEAPQEQSTPPASVAPLNPNSDDTEPKLNPEAIEATPGIKSWPSPSVLRERQQRAKEAREEQEGWKQLQTIPGRDPLWYPDPADKPTLTPSKLRPSDKKDFSQVGEAVASPSSSITPSEVTQGQGGPRVSK